MGNIFKKIAGLFSKKPAATMSVEELRQIFKARYHAFKLLLAANNTALRLMTDMEAALSGNQSFGMLFVRSHCTAVCVNVYAIIKHLNELSGNHYQKLEPVFATIRDRIEAILGKRHVPPIQELVVPFSQADKDLADGLGSKMANLAEIKNKVPGVLVPEGFAITAAAYELFLFHNQLQEEINRRLQSAEFEEIADLYKKSSEIQMLIINSEVPPALAAEIEKAYENLETQLERPPRVAMRSSAIGEDAAETSFAGQYRSELNVSRDNLLTAYKEILASKYALTAVTYRLNKGLRDEDVAMCVGCMPMVDAAVGGVMYSRDPTNIRNDAIFINAVHGLAKTVVDGSVTPDLFVVGRGDPLIIHKREIRDKHQKAVCLEGEGCILQPNPEAQAASLDDAQILELARLALLLEEHFQSPQDVEWSVDAHGRIFILQSRPLKQMDLPLTTDSEVVSRITNPVILRGGETASRGVAAGPAFLVSSNVDLLQFPTGAVLVTAYPHPGWATLLPRAVAVVTDRGGITGHLANVAREFKVPAIFNTGDATQKIINGQMITVDADGRTIYLDRAEELLQTSQAKPSLMLGTPVYETLAEVMSYITPLNLTNPDSPEFHPQNCRTLHDITRFSHEVAVKEMFQFDKGKAIATQSIKQLVVKVPMQWWVLNLEDGFKEELPGKQVHLDNIASLPMLALWEGITAVPWKGPPPVDAKGFMSIVLGSAGSSDIAAPGGDTVFGNRNYFMISKNFCNLTSRLGFHFSTVEALVGEQAYENYIRFAFKGGAADFSRKGRRARFIGELLERYDFKVDVKEDSLFARLEGESQEYMLSRLRVLGYITIHTRQLDMIMADEGKRQHYFEEMSRDLENVAALP